MRISQRGLYALQALIVLALHYSDDVVKIRDIAKEEQLPEKFLETILRDLKRGRFVISTRGANGGYRLQRPPQEIFLGQVLRMMDGPLAPFEDAESLRLRVQQDVKHRLSFGYCLMFAMLLPAFSTKHLSPIFVVSCYALQAADSCFKASG